MNKLNVKPQHLEELRSIFKNYCPKSVIWAYGSRVGGDSHDGSDLDMAVKTFGDKNCSLSKLKELLNDSNIPFLMDIMEFDNISESFQKEILKNYVEIFPVKN